MKYYKLNKEKSLELYNKKDMLIEEKACYTNTYMVVNQYMEKFKSGKWKVAYGYMQIAEDKNVKNLYCRHAFVLDENEKVIDVTLALLCDKDESARNIDDEAKSENKYIIMKVFDDVEEYIDTLMEYDGDACLSFYLKDEYLDLLKWAMENNIMLCG